MEINLFLIIFFGGANSLQEDLGHFPVFASREINNLLVFYFLIGKRIQSQTDEHWRLKTNYKTIRDIIFRKQKPFTL